MNPFLHAQLVYILLQLAVVELTLKTISHRRLRPLGTHADPSRL
ncbi:hypothetical protein [Paenibacillus sp. GCM10023250]